MALKYGLGLLPWSPLAMGVLAGRYADDDIRPAGSRASLRGGIYAERVSQAAVEAGNRFVRVAREVGVDPARLAIGWVMNQPAVTAPIIGPRTVEQLEHLLPVMDMTISADVAAACDEICAPGSAGCQLPQLRAVDEDAYRLTAPRVLRTRRVLSSRQTDWSKACPRTSAVFRPTHSSFTSPS